MIKLCEICGKEAVTDPHDDRELFCPSCLAGTHKGKWYEVIPIRRAHVRTLSIKVGLR